MVDPFVVIRLTISYRGISYGFSFWSSVNAHDGATIIPSNSGHNSHTRRTWSWWREGHAWGSPWVPYKSPASLRTCGGESREGSGQKGVLAILYYLTGDVLNVHGTNVILRIVGQGNYKESFIQRSVLRPITKDIPSSYSSLETFFRCSLWQQQDIKWRDELNYKYQYIGYYSNFKLCCHFDVFTVTVHL